MLYIEVIGALVLIAGVMIFGLKFLKKYVPSMAGPTSMAVIEQLHLGDRCRVMVVKVRDDELLLGVTREAVSILEKLPK